MDSESCVYIFIHTQTRSYYLNNLTQEKTENCKCLVYVLCVSEFLEMNLILKSQTSKPVLIFLKL